MSTTLDWAERAQATRRDAARAQFGAVVLAVGVYEATERFRAIDQHAAVVTPGDMALVAVTGRAGDPEAEAYAELFAAAPNLLAACRAFLAASHGAAGMDGARLLAMAAIAKAEGDA